jgi:hypothetical protein
LQLTDCKTQIAAAYLVQKNVDFLNWNASIFNSNCIDMSVYICVAAVALVYLILIPLTLPKPVAKKAGIVFAIIFRL